MKSLDNITIAMQSVAQSEVSTKDIVDNAKAWLDLTGRLSQENEKMRRLLSMLSVERDAREARISELEEKVAFLQSTIEKQAKALSAFGDQPDGTVQSQRAKESAHSEMMLLLQGNETSRPDKRRREPDWDYFKELTMSNNAMSELNNRRAICYLMLLHKENYIDELFHLKKKYSGNVACHLAKKFRDDVSTETKWAIFERLFGRKNLRTYVNRTLTPRDRTICKHLDDIMSRADIQEQQQQKTATR